MINKISLIITALFTLYIFFQSTDLIDENKELKKELEMYKRAYLDCNTKIIKANEIVAGDSLKTLVYW